jgi:hypothetical protein
LHQLAFPPAVYQGSFFPTSSPTYVVGGVFDDGYSNRGEVESWYGFDLHLWSEMVNIFSRAFLPFEFLL